MKRSALTAAFLLVSGTGCMTMPPEVEVKVVVQLSTEDRERLDKLNTKLDRLSDTADETQLYDVAYFEMRNRLQSITGVIAPAVYG